MNASSFVAALLLMAFFCQSDALVLRRPRWRDEGKGNDDGPDNGISIDGKSNADDDVSDAINILRKIVNDKEFRTRVYGELQGKENKSLRKLVEGAGRH